MSFLIAAGGLVLISLVISFIRPGRYGFAALSLAAGYIFAQFWAETIAGGYKEIGQALGIAPWHDVVYAIVVTLPALLVLFLSPKRQSILPKPIGALALAVLTLALLLPIFSLALIVDDQSRTFYSILEEYKEIVITISLTIGVVDIALARHPKRSKHGKD